MGGNDYEKGYDVESVSIHRKSPGKRLVVEDINKFLFKWIINL